MIKNRISTAKQFQKLWIESMIPVGLAPTITLTSLQYLLKWGYSILGSVLTEVSQVLVSVLTEVSQATWFSTWKISGGKMGMKWVYMIPNGFILRESKDALSI